MEIERIKELLLKQKVVGDEYIIYNPQQEIQTLLLDSRNIFNPENTIFIAITNKKGNDGHKFIEELYNKGIRSFIVEIIPDVLKEKKDVNVIQVKDSRLALVSLGKENRINAKNIVAITGSRGKTTMKELLFQLLEPLKKISRSPRSYNSQIGVPLSLWQIPEGTDLAIIEAGISRKGEMLRLRDMIEPDTVIITNIGEAHSEGFSDIKEKAQEKAILASGKNVKNIIYPFDDKYLNEILRPFMNEKKVLGWSFTDKNANLYIELKEDIRERLKKISYIWNEEVKEIEVTYEDYKDLENAASALAFMLNEGIKSDIIKQRFSEMHVISTRMKVSEGTNGCAVILDPYTSDESSLTPALDFMRRRKMPNQSETLILSDIQHEVDDLETMCMNISRLIAESGVKRLICIGSQLHKYKNFFPNNTEFLASTTEFFKKFSASDFVEEIILIKGGPEYNFKEIYQSLEAKKHETILEVNLDAVIRNYNYFRSCVPNTTGLIAMVKAFGYGVGSYELAKTLQDCGASYLAVAVLDEGIDLRKRGITMPIMVMNPRTANYKAMFVNDLEPVVYSISMLRELLAEADKNGIKKYPIHIKLDTGMHRMGFMENEVDELIEILRNRGELRVTTVFSHLATADCLDMDEFTNRQFELFEKVSGSILSSFNYNIKRHILNSAGIIRFPAYHYDYVRLGIGLYGSNTLPECLEKPLSPVASLKTLIISIREVEVGDAVGYGRKGVATRKLKIATIPIGYADGMNRRFGNGNIKVLVNNKEVPTIGNICMDATMLDVTEIECKEGDPVEIFGENISIQNLADASGTIPYEILTSVSPRVKRVYFRE